MTTLYHGSYTVIQHPAAAIGRRNLDFGQGFYLTELRTQAEKWAFLKTERKTRNGIPQLNIYQFDEALAHRLNLNWLKFESYNIDWLDFIVSCRSGNDLWKHYDIVEGGVANDQVIDTVEDYMMGNISAEQALGQLRYKSVNHQVCVISQEVLDTCLTFIEALTITPRQQ